MSDDHDKRGVRQIDVVQATVDQLAAELEALDAQVLQLTCCCGILVLLVGALLWRR